MCNYNECSRKSYKDTSYCWNHRGQINKKNIQLLSKQEYNNTESAQDSSDMTPQPESTTTIIEQTANTNENKMSTMTEKLVVELKSNTKINELYTSIDNSDKNNQINNDSDIEFDLDEDYDDDSDEEEIKVINNYESDTEIGFDEGYDSENDDPYKIKQIDIECEESNDLFDAKCELLDGVNLDNVHTQIQAEWDKAEQKRLDALQAYNDKMEQKYQAELEAATNQSESESDLENEYEVLETLPSKDVIDPNKVYDQAEINAMRANKYYKLANLLSDQFYMSIDYSKLLFAFKNDSTIDDNQCIFMLRDILSNKFNAWTDMDEDNLIMIISRKTYSNHFSTELLRTKWCKIQKLAKEQQPIEYTNWEKENLANARKAKAKANVSADKESNSVYRFLNQYKSYGDIKASIFYDEYVAFCNNSGNILSKITFAKLLKTHGINVKRTNKLGSCYPITSVSIKNWLEYYLE